MSGGVVLNSLSQGRLSLHTAIHIRKDKMLTFATPFVEDVQNTSIKTIMYTDITHTHTCTHPHHQTLVHRTLAVGVRQPEIVIVVAVPHNEGHRLFSTWKVETRNSLEPVPRLTHLHGKE